jgi:phospholipid/cholesterol/gamma-HCH transport system permease protein
MSTTGDRSTISSKPGSAAIGRLLGRLSDAPGYKSLETASGVVGLLVATARSTVRPPYTWRWGLVEEASLSIRRCLLPLILSMSAFSIGIVMALIAGLLEAIGSVDRAGGGNVTGWTREPGFWVTSMILAGVAGSAMTADLAARKVRDELDAIAVLGVDRMKTLVVPRILAMALTAPLLGMIAVLTAMGASYLVEPLLLDNLTHAAFIDGTMAFVNVSDALSLLAKCAVAGVFIGAVCCYKGLSAKGGAEGVGRAVNEAVLITFVGMWLLNSLWNAVFLANSPATQILRG